MSEYRLRITHPVSVCQGQRNRELAASNSREWGNKLHAARIDKYIASRNSRTHR